LTVVPASAGPTKDTVPDGVRLRELDGLIAEVRWSPDDDRWCEIPLEPSDVLVVVHTAHRGPIAHRILAACGARCYMDRTHAELGPKGRWTDMHVESILNPLIVEALPTESLADVAGRMMFNDVGSVAISEQGQLVGIITERDLSRAIAEGYDPQDTMASDIMSREPAAISPHTPVREAADAMLRLSIRHLPVVVGGAVVGMISIRDVLADLVWTEA
jgi:CBS domain-containing protein